MSGVTNLSSVKNAAQFEYSLFGASVFSDWPAALWLDSSLVWLCRKATHCRCSRTSTHRNGCQSQNPYKKEHIVLFTFTYRWHNYLIAKSRQHSPYTLPVVVTAVFKVYEHEFFCWGMLSVFQHEDVACSNKTRSEALA